MFGSSKNKSLKDIKIKDEMGKLDRAAGTKHFSRWNSGVRSMMM